MELTRRSFIRTALAAAAYAAAPKGILPVYGQGEAKVREFSLSASVAGIDLGTGREFNAWAYNGQVPGPEIRAKAGEIIRVRLKNDLPAATTIHWHGVPVPNEMDGVPGVTQKAVQPGETFLYEFKADPPGSYIYHSHVEYQLDQGLYGPLIIEPSEEKEWDREYTLTLEDWVMKDGGGVAATPRRSTMGMGMMHGRMGMGRGFDRDSGPLQEPIYDAFAVNGKIYPHMEPLTVKKGEKVKLRLMNPSSATIYDLRLAGHSLTITHADGRPVRPLETDVLRIGMGERYDVTFTADHQGHWLLSGINAGYRGNPALQIPIRYTGIRSDSPAPPAFRGPGIRFAGYWDMEALTPESAQPRGEAGNGKEPELLRQTLSGGMHSPYWTINGQVYPNVEPIRFQRNDRVRIAYWNRSMMPHPMHLHGHFFKVVNDRLPPSRWIEKDTIIVNSMQGLMIEFIADNPGEWFHHCHNLYHLMAGMANVVTIR